MCHELALGLAYGLLWPSGMALSTVTVASPVHRQPLASFSLPFPPPTPPRRLPLGGHGKWFNVLGQAWSQLSLVGSGHGHGSSQP